MTRMKPIRVAGGAVLVVFLLHAAPAVAQLAQAAQGAPEPLTADDLLAATRDALQQATLAVRRAVNQTTPIKKSAVDIKRAMDDVSAAIEFVKAHSPEPAEFQMIERPDFTPAKVVGNRLGNLESALGFLKAAFDRLVRVPGGDVGGFRPRIVDDISAAAPDLVEGMKQANDDFLKQRNAGRPQSSQPSASGASAQPAR